MIKLIAIDLDGTLLTDEKTISAGNKAAIQAAKAQGVKVVLCTGRPLNSVLNYLEELGLTETGDYAVTFNGGLVQKNDTGEILSKDVMTHETMADIYALGQSLEIPIDVVSGDIVYNLQPQPEAHPSIYHELNRILTFKDSTVADLPKDRDYNKMVSAMPKEYLEQKLGEIPQAYRDKYSIVRSGTNLFEFLNKNVTKANGLKRLGELLDIQSSEMMALGDEENDLTMIEFAGVGVAMANASDQIKAVADFITLSNEADGVAHAVEKFVLQADK